MAKNKNRYYGPKAAPQNVTLAQLNSYHVTNQPLPSPEEISKFASIHPDMPKRIMDDALAHSEAARDNERKIVAAVAGEATSNNFAVKLRIVVLSLVVIGFFGTGFFLLINGKTLEGFGVLVPAVLWVIKKM